MIRRNEHYLEAGAGAGFLRPLLLPKQYFSLLE